MDKKLFQDLKDSLNEAVEHAEGKRKDLRTTTLIRPPVAMAKTDIVKLREQMNVSQAVFANFLNISVKTVQAWEQGTAKPGGAALKLLSIVKRNPKILMRAT